MTFLCYVCIKLLKDLFSLTSVSGELAVRRCSISIKKTSKLFMKNCSKFNNNI